jgi:hypothetical protein
LGRGRFSPSWTWVSQVPRDYRPCNTSEISQLITYSEHITVMMMMMTCCVYLKS